MTAQFSSTESSRVAGRYTLHDQIASGGMATVYFGQVVGAHGFSRVVAVKRMLPALSRDPTLCAMFVDEARLASRVQHPNVVPILDVVDDGGEVMIVMEYVRGAAFSALLNACVGAGSRVPVPVAASIACGMLAGLHAAHEARDRNGRSLGIVHRDVSPQNVLVGVDGVTRIMDFGVAKAAHRLATTQENQLKGKISYMAPEQFRGGVVDRRTDVFAAAVVLWGALAGRRLFRGPGVAETMEEILRCEVPALASFRDDVPAAVEEAVRHGLRANPDERPASAELFAAEIEEAIRVASSRVTAEWVQAWVGETVRRRDTVIAEIEHTTGVVGGSTPEPEGGAPNLTRDWSRASPRDGDSPHRPTVVVENAGSAPSAPVTTTSAAPKRTFAIAVGAVVALGALVAIAAGADGERPQEPTSVEPSAAPVHTAPARSDPSGPIVEVEPTPPSAIALSSDAAVASAVDASRASAAAPTVAPVAVKPRGPATTKVGPPPPEKTGRGAYYPPSPFPK